MVTFLKSDDDDDIDRIWKRDGVQESLKFEGFDFKKILKDDTISDAIFTSSTLSRFLPQKSLHSRSPKTPSFGANEYENQHVARFNWLHSQAPIRFPSHQQVLLLQSPSFWDKSDKGHVSDVNWVEKWVFDTIPRRPSEDASHPVSTNTLNEIKAEKIKKKKDHQNLARSPIDASTHATPSFLPFDSWSSRKCRRQSTHSSLLLQNPIVRKSTSVAVTAPSAFHCYSEP